ncbi:class I SAM-dependent methyltransferase [Inquilinus sp. CAU 1745]|uniref:class I SAM-dependent methyltransferase n=1 Tax=Inquilinus sp. CAU 1745 TaxID=3140369 RepID=UPI00325AEBA5
MTAPAPTGCPLCRLLSASPWLEVDGSRYHDCGGCGLIFLAPDQRPGAGLERATYDLHENDPDDPRYRAFLSRLVDPLAAALAPGAAGLDFGCGPGPTIAPMMAEAGFSVANYDPFYHPDAAALSRTYDFIACSETVEHFHDPAAEFSRLDGLLNPGGRLGVMTGMVEDRTRFANWNYRRDPTHVAFYSRETMGWIAGRHGWTASFPGRTVTLFTKPPAAG